MRQRIDALVQGLPALLQAGRFDLIHAQDSLSGNALATLQEAGATLPPWMRTVHHLDAFSDPLLAEPGRSPVLAPCRTRWPASVTAGASALLDEHQTRAWRMHNGVNLARYPAPAGPR